MENKQEPNVSHHWNSGRPAWMPGVVLILVGGIFLLRNFYGLQLNNWWALFILIPAFSNLSSAYGEYRSTHEFNRKVRGRLFGGLIFTMLAGALLLGVNFGLLWPAFLILAGIGFLFGAF